MPDTNVLMHLFRYGEKTRNQVLNTLSGLKPNVWIPYWVGFELQQGWRDVDHKNRQAYEELTAKMEAAGNSMKNIFNEYSRHQIIDVAQERKRIDHFVSEFSRRLQRLKAKHPGREVSRKVFDQITDLIGDSIGPKPSNEELVKIYADGERRYKDKIPPGYRDKTRKEGDDIYGDLVIWKQMIAHSRNEQRPIVFITDDLKDDWWLDFNGEKIGPRPELVEEFLAETNQNFYMYSVSSFLEKAAHHLRQDVDAQAIKEIEEDENKLKEIHERRRLAMQYQGALEDLAERRQNILRHLQGVEETRDQLAATRTDNISKYYKSLRGGDDDSRLISEWDERFDAVEHERRIFLKELAQLDDIERRTRRAFEEASEGLHRPE